MFKSPDVKRAVFQKLPNLNNSTVKDTYLVMKQWVVNLITKTDKTSTAKTLKGFPKWPWNFQRQVKFQM